MATSWDGLNDRLTGRCVHAPARRSPRQGPKAVCRTPRPPARRSTAAPWVLRDHRPCHRPLRGPRSRPGRPSPPCLRHRRPPVAGADAGTPRAVVRRTRPTLLGTRPQQRRSSRPCRETGWVGVRDGRAVRVARAGLVGVGTGRGGYGAAATGIGPVGARARTIRPSPGTPAHRLPARPSALALQSAALQLPALLPGQPSSGQLRNRPMRPHRAASRATGWTERAPTCQPKEP